MDPLNLRVVGNLVSDSFFRFLWLSWFFKLLFFLNLLLVEETNLAKMEQSHSGIPENAVFMGSGGDGQLPFIPEESDLMFTVEAEMVGDPVEEA